jgi:enoyl-CoA hydratase/carnithine racemase
VTASGDFLIETEDGISTIIMNRPKQLNAFHPDMVIEFQDVLREVDGDPSTRVIILTGAGRAFTAGGDIKSFGTKPDPRVNRRGWHLIHRMLEVEKPMVAMINGPAVGLGMTLALLCDCTVMAEDATIGDPHVSRGLAAGDGGAVVLPALVGPHRAKELLMTGRLLSGREAGAIGLVNHAVPMDELSATSRGLARELAEQPTYAVRATKMVVNRYIRWMANEVLDVALAFEEISKHLPEHAEAVGEWKDQRKGGSP